MSAIVDDDAQADADDDDDDDDVGGLVQAVAVV
jgi:hypothetical protein